MSRLMNTAMSRVISLASGVALGFACAVSLQAKPAPIELKSLVTDSEIVAVVSVKSITETSRKGPWIFFKNVVIPEKVLKGKVATGTPIDVMYQEADPKKPRVEDSPSKFPKQGSKAMIFLYKDETGAWTPTADQVWEIQDGDFVNATHPYPAVVEKTVQELLKAK